MNERHDQPGSARFVVSRVTLTSPAEDDWVQETTGEWQVIDREKGQVVLTFPWSIKDDLTEWPERHFHDGPREVRIDQARGEVILFYSMEHVHGFTFEGQETPAKVERIAIPGAGEKGPA